MTLVETLRLVLIALSSLSACNQDNIGTNQTRAKLKMAYLIPWTGLFPVGTTMGPVILQALENIKDRGLLSNYDIELHWRDTQCDKAIGVKMLIDIWRDNQDLDVIIGDACSIVCYPASLLASVWNVPIISWGCTLEALSDKSVHPTFSRVIRPSSDRVGILKELVIMFGWNRVGIISETDKVYKEQSIELLSKLRLLNITVFYYSIISFNHKSNNDRVSNNLENVMKSVKDRARILIIFSYGLRLTVLARVSKDNYMEKGYVFLAAYNFAFGVESAKDYPNWLALTVFTPEFNGVSSAVDLKYPLSMEMINSPPVTVQDGLLSMSGDYFCASRYCRIIFSLISKQSVRSPSLL